MRYLAAALVLAACASDPAPAGDAGADTGPTADMGADAGTPGDLGASDAGPTIDDPPVTDTGPTADTADAGAVDTGSDVVRVDGAPCIPACAAGSVCVGGACEAVDGGADAGAVDSGPPRPTAEAMEFQSCEPRGSSCGGDAGVTCSEIPGNRFADAGVQGVCSRPCVASADCPAPALCVEGRCWIECLDGVTSLDALCMARGLLCRVSAVAAPDTRGTPAPASPFRSAYCAP
jgi:hypothetical protein